MHKLIVAAILICSPAGAGVALAGQCYTAAGRPTGPAYGPDQPDREWIAYVRARGGHCTGVDAAVPDQRFSEHEVPNHRHWLHHRQSRRN